MDCQCPRQPRTTAALQFPSASMGCSWEVAPCNSRAFKTHPRHWRLGERTGEQGGDGIGTIKSSFSCTLRANVRHGVCFINHSGMWRSRICAKGTGKASTALWCKSMRDGHLRSPLQCLCRRLQSQLPPQESHSAAFKTAPTAPHLILLFILLYLSH